MKINSLSQVNLSTDLSVLLQNLGKENEGFTFQDIFLFLVNSLYGQDLEDEFNSIITDPTKTNSKFSKDDRTSFSKQIQNGGKGKEESLDKIWSLFLEFITLSINYSTYNFSTSNFSTSHLTTSNLSTSTQIAEENISNFTKDLEIKDFIKILKDDLKLRPSYQFREETTLSKLWEHTASVEEKEFFISAQREFIKFLKESLQDLRPSFKEEHPILSLREKFNALPEALKVQIRERLSLLTPLSSQENKSSQEINFYNAFKEIGSNNLVKISPEKGKNENITDNKKENEAIGRDSFLKMVGIRDEETFSQRIREILNKGRLRLDESSLFEKTFINRAKGEETVISDIKGYLTKEGLETSQANAIKLQQGTLKVETKLGLENISQVIKDFSIELKPSGERKAHLELEPPELGKMELMVKVKDGEVEVFARVEKAETLSQLKQEFSQIKTELESLGLKLKDFQLSLGFMGEGKNFFERGDSEQRKFKPKKIEDLILSKIEAEPTYFHQGSLYKIV